ncbi:MAG: glycosyltransferase [Prevotellaceae bacterium]|jgi:uncharacterized protein (TIGR00661 family)|nr:glycosyltransferase [Prevotellaceae bacterium]
MKYIFIVQGEGRGHLTQAISMRDLLAGNGHEVTEVLVGKRRAATLPQFFSKRMYPCPVSTFESPYFLFSSKNKKSLLLKSILLNLFKLPVYLGNAAFISRRIRKSDADAVVNFYEVVTGLAYAFFRPGKPCICVAHQYLFLHPRFVLPPKSKLELAALLFFTRLTAMNAHRLLALSLREMPHDRRIFVVPPLLRKEVMQKTSRKEGYILGYMLNESFSEEVIAWHRQHPEMPLHFFWSKKGAPGTLEVDGNLALHQLDDSSFLDFMSRCSAYASTGGFESICEAMYLRKPVMMVPAHIEQECNAFDAVGAGAGIASPAFDLTLLMQYLPAYRENSGFSEWVAQADSLIAEALAVP